MTSLSCGGPAGPEHHFTEREIREDAYRLWSPPEPLALKARLLEHLRYLLVDHEIGGNKAHSLLIVQPVGNTLQVGRVRRPKFPDKLVHAFVLELIRARNRVVLYPGGQVNGRPSATVSMAVLSQRVHEYIRTHRSSTHCMAVV